jgi:septum formation topological specificity factor MinE
VEKRDLIEAEQKEILEYINKYLNIEHLIERKKW